MVDHNSGGLIYPQYLEETVVDHNSGGLIYPQCLEETVVDHNSGGLISTIPGGDCG